MARCQSQQCLLLQFKLSFISPKKFIFLLLHICGSLIFSYLAKRPKPWEGPLVILTAAAIVKASPLILALILQRSCWLVLSEDSPQTHTQRRSLSTLLWQRKAGRHNTLPLIVIPETLRCPDSTGEIYTGVLYISPVYTSTPAY